MQLGGSTRPARIRVLDLPFTAVEWVVPAHAPGSAPHADPDSWMVRLVMCL